ncbi:MAG: hypothetical protein LBL23_03835, partial [Coriobacteriales bacterium]|nr:hypothetical protein [Coriobacteriales bacterium]
WRMTQAHAGYSGGNRRANATESEPPLTMSTTGGATEARPGCSGASTGIIRRVSTVSRTRSVRDTFSMQPFYPESPQSSYNKQATTPPVRLRWS